MFGDLSGTGKESWVFIVSGVLAFSAINIPHMKTKGQFPAKHEWKSGLFAFLLFCKQLKKLIYQLKSRFKSLVLLFKTR